MLLKHEVQFHCELKAMQSLHSKIRISGWIQEAGISFYGFNWTK